MTGFFFSSRRRHTRCALVTGVQTCALPISEGTRGKFPQLSPDLSVRWCSAYLKIDVMAASIRNQDRFLGKRTLVVTGERAQESVASSKYQTFERHRTDTRDGTRKAHPVTSTKARRVGNECVSEVHHRRPPQQ